MERIKKVCPISHLTMATGAAPACLTTLVMASTQTRINYNHINTIQVAEINQSENEKVKILRSGEHEFLYIRAGYRLK